jgi:hypothetical protein
MPVVHKVGSASSRCRRVMARVGEGDAVDPEYALEHNVFEAWLGLDINGTVYGSAGARMGCKPGNKLLHYPNIRP